ncbi:type II toxin-antitoxin system PemK/MazF family toxin [Priestia aryabhattai]|uniref:type II toxin-antitoxin system PemK/MazF family toxin n=1 Tax=Priestia aryabhattai TaxID=412384 RepID=UPI003D26AED0
MSVNKREERLARDRANANQGEFFFATIRLSDGNEYRRPVFVIGKNGDSNDEEDVIVCSCTTTDTRSNYDQEVQLKFKTFVRTNKIYTTTREKLEFKINSGLDSQAIQNLLAYCQRAIS